MPAVFFLFLELEIILGNKEALSTLIIKILFLSNFPV